MPPVGQTELSMDSQPGTGPRAPLSKARVLETAVRLADRHGIESLSMRKLADELRVAAMSLYYHVPNKDELIDGMVDIVFTEIDLPAGDVHWRAAGRPPAPSPPAGPNRPPPAAGVVGARRTPGPASIRVHNAVLGYLREGGFSVETTVQAYSVLDAYIYGFALQEKTVPFEDAEESAAAAEEQARQFEADEQTAALAEEYPYIAEVVAGHVATVGYDFGTAFEHGLDLILDALEQRRDEA